MNEEYYDDEEEYIEYAVRPNKTQIKREIAEIAEVAEEMTTLSKSQLDDLNLPEQIHKAIQEAAGMPHKAARKRLLKYIVGNLRKIDMEPINEQLAKIKNKSAHAVREHHQVERWRDRLIAEDNAALTELLSKYPHADSQQLRQLIRNAKKELAAEKPPKSSRLIYRYLKDLFGHEDEDFTE